MDLGAIGYVPAGRAIADTLAENSLKLISMKGLMEKHLANVDHKLDDDADNLLQLMDSLL